MIGDPNASPATPPPLLAAAPAIPETWVPCPHGSVGVPAAQLLPTPVPPEAALPPARTGCAAVPRGRAGCVASTPVSTMPIGGPAGGVKVPGKSDQPARAEIAGSAH